MLTTLAALVSGTGGVYLITRLLRWWKWFPAHEGQAARLRAVAGVLSAIAVVVGGVASGNIAPESVQDVVVKLLEFAVMWAGAHTVHTVIKK